MSETLTIVGSSLVGFSTVIGILIYNQRQNDTRIRDLCDRLARMEERIKGIMKHD
jgi:predicted ABC-type transport system involved in lysophospholipase L1 biosynthesis ATPase subunit